jgi:hypothetical protein
MEEAAQQGDDDVSPSLRRIRRGILGLSLTGPFAARGLWGLDSWPQAAVSVLIVSGIAALATRALVHRHLGYRSSLPKPYQAECGFVGLATLAYSLTFVAQTWFSLSGYIGLPLTALAYGWMDDGMTRSRAKEGIPSATDWFRDRPAWGHTMGEVTDEGSHGVARAVAAVTAPRDRKGRRRVPEGATFAGTLLLTLFTSASLSFASAPAGALLHERRAPAADRSGGSTEPTVPPELHEAAEPLPSYDEVCGAGALQPGESAPAWAERGLWRLWLGEGRGVGALLGGCVVPFEQVPGHPDIVFQAGYIGGGLRGVGVSLKSGPSTIYLDQAAAEVLRLLRGGRVVAGRNGGVVHSLDSMRELPSGRLYIPGS